MAHLGFGELGHVLLELALLVAPGEEVYDCVKPALASAFISLGRVKASAGRSPRVRSMDLAISTPRSRRLGVRVVDAEDLYPMLDPNHEHTIELGEEPDAIRGVEVHAAHV